MIEDNHGLTAKLEALHVDESQSILKLRDLQKDHHDLELLLEAELFQLERKYHALYSKLYEVRATIVRGQTTGEKGIPGFWLKAFLNHSVLKDVISNEDRGPLEYLVDVGIIYLSDNQPDFALEFVFDRNGYIDNDRITKSYLFRQEDGSFVFDHSEASPVQWKPGRRFPRGSRSAPREGFMDTFFSPPIAPAGDDPEEMEQYNDMLSMDCAIGNILKNTIIPSAIDFYLGEVQDDEYEEDSE